MMYLEDYRKIPVAPNYEKPKITKQDAKRGHNERLYADLVSVCFLCVMGTVFLLIALATGDYVLTITGLLLIAAYIACVCFLSVRHKMRDGSLYLLVDKIMELDEDIGLTQCLFILYQEETDTYLKAETVYHIYRGAKTGDWVFMYSTDDNIYVIPEYPNREWFDRKEE